MAKIYVLLAELEELSGKLKKTSTDLAKIESQFASHGRSLDWEIKSRQQISNIINAISANLKKLEIVGGRQSAYLTNAKRQYEATEKQILNSSVLQTNNALYGTDMIRVGGLAVGAASGLESTPDSIPSGIKDILKMLEQMAPIYDLLALLGIVPKIPISTLINTANAIASAVDAVVDTVRGWSDSISNKLSDITGWDWSGKMDTYTEVSGGYSNKAEWGINKNPENKGYNSGEKFDKSLDEQLEENAKISIIKVGAGFDSSLAYAGTEDSININGIDMSYGGGIGIGNVSAGASAEITTDAVKLAVGMAGSVLSASGTAKVGNEYVNATLDGKVDVLSGEVSGEMEVNLKEGKLKGEFAAMASVASAEGKTAIKVGFITIELGGKASVLSVGAKGKAEIDLESGEFNFSGGAGVGLFGLEGDVGIKIDYKEAANYFNSAISAVDKWFQGSAGGGGGSW